MEAMKRKILTCILLGLVLGVSGVEAKQAGVLLQEGLYAEEIDGDLDKVEASEIVAKIASYMRIYKPHVVLTFGPEGAYGHPDHIAISQFTTTATVCAADPGYSSNNGLPMPSEPHRVVKLYYMSWTRPKWDAYQAAFKELKSVVDGVERRPTPAPDWFITTRIDTTETTGKQRVNDTGSIAGYCFIF